MEIEANNHPIPPKVVWIISDGVAGHYNQSKGVLAALGKITAIDSYWLEFKLKGGWLRLVLSTLLNVWGTNMSPKYLSWFYRHADLPTERPDMIVGTGGKISFAVVWLAGFFGAASIFCGSVRRLNPALFSAVITVEKESAPQYIEVEAYPTHVTPLDSDKTADAKVWALLIGGNREGIYYTHADWSQLANQINALSQMHGIRWLITTSRRTGLETEQALASLIAPEYILDVAWWSSDERPVIQDYLNRASVVVCTADSHSMLTEAIVMQHKVIALHPQDFNPDSVYMGMLKRYVRKQRIKLGDIRQLSALYAQLDAIVPFAHNLTHALALKLQHHPFLNDGFTRVDDTFFSKIPKKSD